MKDRIRVGAGWKMEEKALGQRSAGYVRRLSAFTRMEIIEVADEHAPQSNSDAENELVKEREGERVLARIKDGEYVILLDLWGKMFDSEGFARKIDTLQVQGKGTLTFVIAGSLGPSPAVVKRAELRWKLSDLTFPHQPTRLPVLEQVYRAHMILPAPPYPQCNPAKTVRIRAKRPL